LSLLIHVFGCGARRPSSMSKSSNKLSMHIGSEIGLRNFSFSQLVLEVKRLSVKSGSLTVTNTNTSVYMLALVFDGPQKTLLIEPLNL
jgi:hypothetical protein